MTVTEILTLMKMKLDILKLKADDYTWACHTPQDVKDELERMLVRINKELAAVEKEGEKDE